MELPDQKWAEIIGQARQSVDFLKDQDVIGTVLNILQTNTSIATALRTFFLPQISLIFLDMLNVYRMYSELISSSIAEGGPFTSKTSYVKLLRSVKRETLKLIETFLDKAEDQPQIRKQFVPPIINKYKGVMTEDVPCIFEAVFECTLGNFFFFVEPFICLTLIRKFPHDHKPIGQIIIICGRNKILASTLETGQWKVPVKIRGFETQMEKWMGACGLHYNQCWTWNNCVGVDKVPSNHEAMAR